MANCSCGNVEVDASGFAFSDHRLHGSEACAHQHTLGEVIRAVVDGSRNAADVARTLGEDTHVLVGEALARLSDAGVLRFTNGSGGGAAVELAEGIGSQDDAERKLVDGGAHRPGDLVA